MRGGGENVSHNFIYITQFVYHIMFPPTGKDEGT